MAAGEFLDYRWKATTREIEGLSEKCRDAVWGISPHGLSPSHLAGSDHLRGAACDGAATAAERWSGAPKGGALYFFNGLLARTLRIVDSMSIHLYHLAVFLHLLAALLWLGGMFFLGVVGAPVLRKLEPAALRARLFHELGLRFRTVGWISLGVLVATGLWILHMRGVLRADVLTDSTWWATPFGRALFWKLMAVVAMVVVSALHDFVFGPRAGRALEEAGEAARERNRRLALHLARINAGFGLFLVYWAMRLARGG